MTKIIGISIVLLCNNTHIVPKRHVSARPLTFSVIGVFPPAWYQNVSEIAAKSPLLLSMGAEQFLDKELEVNHPLKIENIAAVSY